MASQIRPRALLCLAVIGLAVMLTGCEAYPAYGYGSGAPYYGGTYFGIGGGWNTYSRHGQGWHGGEWHGHDGHNHGSHGASGHGGHHGGGRH